MARRAEAHQVGPGMCATVDQRQDVMHLRRWRPTVGAAADLTPRISRQLRARRLRQRRSYPRCVEVGRTRREWVRLRVRGRLGIGSARAAIAEVVFEPVGLANCTPTCPATTRTSITCYATVGSTTLWFSSV